MVKQKAIKDETGTTILCVTNLFNKFTGAFWETFEIKEFIDFRLEYCILE